MKKSRSRRRVKKSMKELQKWSGSLPSSVKDIINMMAECNTILLDNIKGGVAE